MIYNVAKLRNAIIDFYNISGLMTVLYDDSFNVICSYPPGMNEFCREVRRSGSLTARCIGCDRRGFALCGESRGKVIYKCHLGLTEAIAPVLDGGVILGYLMLGQAVVDGDRELIRDSVAKLTDEPESSREAMLKALDGLGMISEEKLNSATRIMEMCASYLYTSGMITPRRDETRESIENYVSSNLSDPSLDMRSICRALSLSRSSLYALSKEFFGMGISDYVRFCRMEKAKELLLTTNMPISRIASACGFNQANHFTKTFKALVGILPKDYKY